MESKDYSWEWVTASRLLSHGPCELLFAYMTVGTGCVGANLYNGESTAEELIVTLESAVATGHPFSPPVPIYCSRGLYVEVAAAVTGIFIQWRNL